MYNYARTEPCSSGNAMYAIDVDDYDDDDDDKQGGGCDGNGFQFILLTCKTWSQVNAHHFVSNRTRYMHVST